MAALTNERRCTVLLSCATAMIAASAYAQDTRKPHIITAEKYAGSVFRVEVEDGESTIPRMGSAFPIHATEPRENPTVWFLTAAHVLFGPQARFESDPSRLKRVVVRKGGGQSWEVDRSTIQVPANWDARGLDFAVMKVTGMGQHMTVVPLVGGILKARSEFMAIGYPDGQNVQLPAEGAVILEPGVLPKPWYVVSGNIVPGMSGGPAFTEEGVFATVRGGDDAIGKYMVPVSLSATLLQESIPGWRTKATAFQIMKDPERRVKGSVVQREFLVQNINVDCNQVKRDKLTFKLPLRPGEELVDATAVFTNARNVSLQNVRGVPTSSGEVSIDYALAGLPQNVSTFFNCAGGGQAELKVVASVKTPAG